MRPESGSGGMLEFRRPMIDQYEGFGSLLGRLRAERGLSLRDLAGLARIFKSKIHYLAPATGTTAAQSSAEMSAFDQCANTLCVMAKSPLADAPIFTLLRHLMNGDEVGLGR
jgi:hypothetical protein